MKYFEVTGVKATFNEGSVLGLTPEQASPRQHKLAFVKTEGNIGIYNVTGPLEFKNGEILVVLSEVNKSQLAELDESSAKLHAKKSAEEKKKAARSNQAKPDPVKVEKPAAKEDEAKTESPAETGGSSRLPATAPAKPKKSAAKSGKKAGK